MQIRARLDTAGRKTPLGRMVIVQTDPHLAKIVVARHSPSRCPGCLHRRHQERNQNADHGNHHQQFYQGETTPAGNAIESGQSPVHGVRTSRRRTQTTRECSAQVTTEYRAERLLAGLKEPCFLRNLSHAEIPPVSALVGLLTPELGLAQPSRRPKGATMAKKNEQPFFTLGYSGGAVPEFHPRVPCLSALRRKWPTTNAQCNNSSPSLAERFSLVKHLWKPSAASILWRSRW